MLLIALEITIPNMIIDRVTTKYENNNNDNLYNTTLFFGSTEYRVSHEQNTFISNRSASIF